jgi:hypothetical protein
MQGNAAYFSARAAEERALAGKATHPEARAAHRQLAERYEVYATWVQGRQGN